MNIVCLKTSDIRWATCAMRCVWVSVVNFKTIIQNAITNAYSSKILITMRYIAQHIVCHLNIKSLCCENITAEIKHAYNVSLFITKRIIYNCSFTEKFQIYVIKILLAASRSKQFLSKNISNEAAVFEVTNTRIL